MLARKHLTPAEALKEEASCLIRTLLSWIARLAHSRGHVGARAASEKCQEYLKLG